MHSIFKPYFHIFGYCLLLHRIFLKIPLYEALSFSLYFCKVSIESTRQKTSYDKFFDIVISKVLACEALHFISGKQN